MAARLSAIGSRRLQCLTGRVSCAFKSIDTFKGDSELSTWLHRILVNSALMHLRAKRRWAEADGGEIDELLPRFDTAGNWIDECSHSAPAHVLFEASETRARVRRCIELLPDNYRTVLILRDIEELATEEVASLLDVTPSNVKVRLHRARQALKVLLERDTNSSCFGPIMTRTIFSEQRPC